MRIRDLGELTGPVLVFGGPVSNIDATRAMLDQARRLGIGPGQVICTGDLAAYCGAPAETVAAIRDFGCAVVSGNMEKALALGADSCGFAADSACDVLSGAWFAHADAHVGADDRAWMADLPDLITFTHAGRRCVVLHGGASDIARFLWPVTESGVFEEEWNIVQSEIGPVDRVISGHSGLPFLRDLARRDWLNAGSVGMPPHDGHPATRFASIGADGTARIETLDYDHAAAATRMRAARLTQGYDRALETGYWPSEDVLPPALRRPEPSRASG